LVSIIKEALMKRTYLFSIIVILAASALSACSGGGGGGAPAQPARADVLIAFDQPVSNLAALQFKLNNTAGATFDNNASQIFAINAALGSIIAGNFDAASNSMTIGLANSGAGGISTGTDPIIRITYAVAEGSGQPTFSVDASAGTFTAISDVSGSPTTPPVTSANVVVTVTYQ
jgi:hypothetical protein